MALQHFSHIHPLVLDEKTDCNNTAGKEILCYGCHKPIMAGSSAYSCRNTDDQCQHLFLHKTCAELPKEIKHPMHAIVEHTLEIKQIPPVNGLACYCEICQSKVSGFYYGCPKCDFDVHVNCAFESSSLRHEGHEHELTLIPQSASFHCHICSRKTEDSSYHCPTCPFWMHKSCANLPKTIYTGFHNHQLTLSYSIPRICSDIIFQLYCRICSEIMKQRNWLYMCGECRIFVHTKCTIERTTCDDMMLRCGKSENVERDLDTNLFNFPAPDESSVDLIMHQFVKDVSIAAAQVDKIEAGNEITVWNHNEHPLILLDNHPLHQNEDHNETKENDKILICNGCVNRISPKNPYYACPKCNFMLHKICTELPLEMKHPFHPHHPLQLCKFRSQLDYIKCNSCDVHSNGFFYACKRCMFYMDLGCATLPTTMKHEAHTHPLILSNLTHKNFHTLCKACEYQILSGKEYRCEAACDFHVHENCATRLRRMIRHKWDDHAIQLVYGSTKNDGVIFYCEICEEDINPKFWFYTCHKCDYSFHPRCLYPFDEYGNVKFGSRHKFFSHPHDLTFVRSTGDIKCYPHSLRFIPKSSNSKSPPLCNSCGKAQIKEPVLECAPCKFLLCMWCASPLKFGSKYKFDSHRHDLTFVRSIDDIES